MKDDSSDSDSDDDIEKAMAKEASQIKSIKPVERRFQNVDCKAKNCIFIKTILGSPCDLADTIFTDLEEKKVQKTRHAIRMMPITATCKAVIKNIEETAEILFKPHFETEFGVGLKYTSVCKIRNNQSISRTAILPSLGKIIREMNPLHMLCHDEPDLVVLIEILRNICCLSVVKNFFRFKKYNLHEVVKKSEQYVNLQPVTLKNVEEAGKTEAVNQTDSSEKMSERDAVSKPLSKETDLSEDKNGESSTKVVSNTEIDNDGNSKTTNESEAAEKSEENEQRNNTDSLKSEVKSTRDNPSEDLIQSEVSTNSNIPDDDVENVSDNLTTNDKDVTDNFRTDEKDGIKDTLGTD